MATNRVYKGYSRFRHIKKTAELGVYLHDPRHSISAGNGVFYAFCGDVEAATPLLTVIS